MAPMSDSTDEQFLKYAVILNDVSAKWSPSIPKYTLQSVTMSVGRGSLIALIGPNGAGKVRASFFVSLNSYMYSSSLICIYH